MPTFLKVSFACSVQCNQIFGPRKARILVKKQEKMRQPKMSHFLAREQPPKSATFARNHEILSHWLRISMSLPFASLLLFFFFST